MFFHKYCSVWISICGSVMLYSPNTAEIQLNNTVESSRLSLTQSHTRTLLRYAWCWLMAPACLVIQLSFNKVEFNNLHSHCPHQVRETSYKHLNFSSKSLSHLSCSLDTKGKYKMKKTMKQIFSITDQSQCSLLSLC